MVVAEPANPPSSLSPSPGQGCNEWHHTLPSQAFLSSVAIAESTVPPSSLGLTQTATVTLTTLVLRDIRHQCSAPATACEWTPLSWAPPHLERREQVWDRSNHTRRPLRMGMEPQIIHVNLSCTVSFNARVRLSTATNAQSHTTIHDSDLDRTP